MTFNVPSWAEQSGDSPQLIVATRNKHKLLEFQRILGDTPWNLIAMNDAGFSGDVDEPFDTYRQNAEHKATVVCRALNRAVIADDSGIEIIALDGWPGHRSARWLGAKANDSDRLKALVERVHRDVATDTRARYVSAIALAVPGREVVTVMGTSEGMIVSPHGINGFGYDPAFFSDDLGMTFAEADDEEKDSVSHRGRALRELAHKELGVR